MSQRLVAGLRFKANPGTDSGGTEKNVTVNKDRDAWPLHLLVSSVVQENDVQDGLFNVPSPDLAEHALKKIFRPGDLVVVSTRPPLHDRLDNARKRVLPGENWLDERICCASEQLLSWLSRGHALLSPYGAKCLAPGFEDRASIEFQPAASEALYQRLGPLSPPLPSRREIQDCASGDSALRPQLARQYLSRHTWHAPNSSCSAGYVAFLREIWPSGPDALLVFGMSGPMTHGFVSAACEIWRHVFPGGIFEGLGFTSSELIFVEISALVGSVLLPSQTPGYPRYWRNWHLKWNRRGRIEDWPDRCPPRTRP